MLVMTVAAVTAFASTAFASHPKGLLAVNVDQRRDSGTISAMARLPAAVGWT
jgi:hypothetical protein